FFLVFFFIFLSFNTIDIPEASNQAIDPFSTYFFDLNAMPDDPIDEGHSTPDLFWILRTDEVRTFSLQLQRRGARMETGTRSSFGRPSPITLLA
ncbi:hypothetical protein LINPERPRIM_LOCUS713, partial [Linum perenne]